MFTGLVPIENKNDRPSQKELKEHTTEYLCRKHVDLVKELENKRVFSSKLNKIRAQSSLNVELEASLGHLGLDTHTLAQIRMTQALKRNLIIQANQNKYQQEHRRKIDSTMPANLNYEQRMDWELHCLERKCHHMKHPRLPSIDKR